MLINCCLPSRQLPMFRRRQQHPGSCRKLFRCDPDVVRRFFLHAGIARRVIGRIHRQQHANLLGTLHHVIPQAISGDFCMPRQVLDMLPQWFLGHLVKMDAGLVKALNMAGARPVVQADASPV